MADPPPHEREPRDDDAERSQGSSGPLSFEPDPAPAHWVRRRDPDLEPAGAGAGGEPSVPRPRGNPYSWLFGVVVVLLLSYIAINTLRNVGGANRGVTPGHRTPAFAAPLALSKLDGDVNVATRGREGPRGARAACDVRGPEVLNVCDLGASAPLVLAFVATEAGKCNDQLDAIERVRSRFAGVRFAAVAARTDRAALRKLIRKRGWGFPVGYDRDGAAFAIYGVVDCPTLTFAYPGRIVMRTTVRPLGDAQLAAVVRRLVAASERRGWKPPAPA